MRFKSIRCQEPTCEYGKKHCCFGEIDLDEIKAGHIIERHKCKANNKKMIYIRLPYQIKYAKGPPNRE